MKRRAQAALEYLTTYGWALIAIIGAIGIMAYAGIGDVSSQIPTKCELGSTMSCGGYIATVNGTFAFEFINYEGSAINVTGFACFYPYENSGLLYDLTVPEVVAQGDRRVILCDASNHPQFPFDYKGKKLFEVKIFYKLAEEQALPKIASGDLVVGVSEDASIYNEYAVNALPANFVNLYSIE